MNEAGMWKHLRPHFKQWGLDPIRVENAVDRGTPDVSIVTGWVELKYLRAWPVREDTPVRLPKLEAHQAAWMARRWAAGGPCWLLVRVADALCLFAGADAPAVRRGLPKGAFLGQARSRCKLDRLDELRLFLTQTRSV